MTTVAVAEDELRRPPSSLPLAAEDAAAGCRGCGCGVGGEAFGCRDAAEVWEAWEVWEVWLGRRLTILRQGASMHARQTFPVAVAAAKRKRREGQQGGTDLTPQVYPIRGR